MLQIKSVAAAFLVLTLFHVIAAVVSVAVLTRARG